MKTRHIKNLIYNYPEIQLDKKEILLTAKTVISTEECNLLVFGMGHDTPFWIELNGEGHTAFLEDNFQWYRKIIKSCPYAESYFINYTTKISEWEELLDKPDKLQVKLPEKIINTRWDVILVDGPAGAFTEYHIEKIIEPPGRMSSIYMASKLVKDEGHVFVHDCNRIVERIYADRYLYDVNLVEQTTTESRLKHYKMTHR